MASGGEAAALDWGSSTRQQATVKPLEAPRSRPAATDPSTSWLPEHLHVNLCEARPAQHQSRASVEDASNILQLIRPPGAANPWRSQASALTALVEFPHGFCDVCVPVIMCGWPIWSEREDEPTSARSALTVWPVAYGLRR